MVMITVSFDQSTFINFIDFLGQSVVLKILARKYARIWGSNRFYGKLIGNWIQIDDIIKGIVEGVIGLRKCGLRKKKDKGGKNQVFHGLRFWI